MQGTQIGPFLVGSKLGRKKRNSVYRAWQVEQDRAVALKFIKVPPVVSLPRAMGRLRRESSILRQLNHPNLVRFHGTGMENGKFFFAMDLIEGESLAAILSRRNKLAWELAWDYARQIACCLEYLHSREMMHLKLMPDKILITKEGQVKITDHRLNRKKRKRWDSPRKKTMERAGYMSPEQFEGGSGGYRSDFYTLGVLLFEMLTGRLPYTGNSFAVLGNHKLTRKAPIVSEFSLECPVWLEKLVESLLNRDPEKRPFSARAIVVALDEVKRADSQGTGVAQKLVSGFSPLTAGQDKTAARQVLRIPNAKQREQRFSQSTGFIATALCAVVFLMFSLLMFAMAPKSSQQLMIDAEGMMVKGETYSAQKALLEVLDRGAGDFQEDAEFLLVKIRMKKLMSWAKDRPLLANQTAKGSTKDFLKAFDYEELQRYDDALTYYNKILRQVSAEPLEGRHLYLAALQRKKALLELLSNQAGQSESLPGVPSPIRFQPELPSSGEKSLFPPIEENSMRKASETATG